MKSNILIVIVAFALLAVAGAQHVPHSTVTYIIVPFKDVTKEMIELVAQSSTETLRHSVSGEDRVVLEFVVYKNPVDPMPVLTPNDKEMTKEALEHNDAKLSTYDHAHTTTPVLLQSYKQYSHKEILVEMVKLDWKGPEEE